MDAKLVLPLRTLIHLHWILIKEELSVTGNFVVMLCV